MLREWTDDLPDVQSDKIWRASFERQTTLRLKWIERELKSAIEQRNVPMGGVFDAMRHFLTLREKLFPGLPSDPAWKMLLTLGQTPADSDLTCVTSVAYGAEVPLTTALRYIAIMEVQGIVERAPHPDDARRVMIRLTPDGRRRLDEIADKWMVRLAVLLVMPVLMTVFAHLA